MEVIKDTENGKALIYITGEVDSANVDEFERLIMDAVNGEENVVIDLKDFEYVSSAGLRVFLMVQKMFGQGDALSIRNANEEVLDIFSVTGFTKLLHLV